MDTAIGFIFAGVCPTLIAPHNGSVSVSHYFANGIATFACNAKYGMIGEERIVCNSNGNWSDQPPICDRK